MAAISKSAMALLLGLGVALPACSGSFTAIDDNQPAQSNPSDHEDPHPQAIP